MWAPCRRCTRPWNRHPEDPNRPRRTLSDLFPLPPIPLARTGPPRSLAYPTSLGYTDMGSELCRRLHVVWQLYILRCLSDWFDGVAERVRSSPLEPPQQESHPYRESSRRGRAMTCIGYGTQTCPLAIPCLGPCRYVETRQGWHPTHDPIQTPASHNRVCDLCGITDDEYIQAALPCL